MQKTISTLATWTWLGLALAAAAQAQFSPGFEPFGLGPIFTVATFDDGTGEAFYAGGNFGTADGVAVNRVARWDGSSWSAVGGLPVNPGLVGAVLVLETLAGVDAGGSSLYAGGDFGELGGVAANSIARWDGEAWQPLGSGLGSDVLAITTFDAGDGTKIYAGTRSGGVHAWDGAGWSTVINPASVDGEVRALAVFDDGTGAKLYFAGSFKNVGAVAAGFIASWNGSAVSELAGGLDATFGDFRAGVEDLCVYGGRLYAGGNYDRVDGLAGRDVASWDGTSWDQAAADPPGGPVRSLTLFVQGGDGGEQLVATGDPIRPGASPRGAVVAWDGAAWTALHSSDAPSITDLEGSLDGPVYDAAVFDDGGGAALHVGGSFRSDGIRVALNSARFAGGQWQKLSDRTTLALDTGARALERLTFGGQTALYAAGFFNRASDVVVDEVAVFDAGGWMPVRSRFQGLGSFAALNALTVYDDGGGERLIAAGRLFRNEPPLLDDVAAWDGVEWSPLLGGQAFGGAGGPFLGPVALEVVDFGGGFGPTSELIIAGEFDEVDGQVVNNLVSWDGAAFSALAGGVDRTVRALRFFDDGSGPALYAGGDFDTAGGLALPFLARFDGTSWSSVGFDAPNARVQAFEVFDDGGGPALFVGGRFGKIGSQQVNLIAKWNGSSFDPLSGPSSVGLISASGEGVISLAVADAGDGPKLWVGGDFETAGGVASRNLAAWDGSRWSAPIGANDDGFKLGGAQAFPSALAGFDDGSGPALYAAGSFTTIYGLTSHYVGRYQESSELFTDGFESGETSGWTLTVP